MFCFGRYRRFFCRGPCSIAVSDSFDRFALCCMADIAGIGSYTILFTCRWYLCDRPVVICLCDHFSHCKFLTTCDAVCVSRVAFFFARCYLFISDLCLCMSSWYYRLFFCLFARLTYVYFNTF